MPDAPITASGLLSIGFRRDDGAEDAFSYRIHPLLEVRIVQVMTGSWRPTVVHCGVHYPHALIAGMSELWRLTERVSADYPETPG